MYRIGFVDPGEDRHHINEELAVATCGQMKLLAQDEKNHAVNRPNGFPDYQLIYVHKGKGTFLLDGEMQVLSAGHAVLYRPDQPQHYFYHSSDGTETYWIHFGGSRAAELLERLGLNRSVMVFYTAAPYIKIMDRMIRVASSANPRRSLICSGLLVTLLCEAAEASSDNAAENRFIAAACEMIKENYNCKLTNEQLAERCGFSVSRFEHLFRETYGCAPQQYKRNEQILVAKELLLNTESTVAEIAETVGFEDPLYFSRIFKSQTGETPSAFRLKV